MAVTLPATNNFEGGTSGSAITAAGSGGVSGTAFDLVTIAATDTLTWDNAQHAHGGLSAKMVKGTTSSSTYVEWDLSATTTTTCYARLYLYITGSPSSNPIRLISLFSGSGTHCGGVRINTAGTLQAINAANTAVGSASAALATNAWNRIEVLLTPSTTVGQIDFKLWKTAADSTGAADSTITNANAVLAANYDRIRFGQGAGVAETSSYTFWMDDPNWNQTGYPGPYRTSLVTQARGVQRHLLAR